jgi:hypothetical protein
MALAHKGTVKEGVELAFPPYPMHSYVPKTIDLLAFHLARVAFLLIVRL